MKVIDRKKEMSSVCLYLISNFNKYCPQEYPEKTEFFTSLQQKSPMAVYHVSKILTSNTLTLTETDLSYLYAQNIDLRREVGLFINNDTDCLSRLNILESRLKDPIQIEKVKHAKDFINAQNDIEIDPTWVFDLNLLVTSSDLQIIDLLNLYEIMSYLSSQLHELESNV